jgi:membrane-associated phospholipid phosphatase
MMIRLASLDAALSQWLTLSPESVGWRPARLAAHVGDGQYMFGGLGLVGLWGWWQQYVELSWGSLTAILVILTAGIAATLVKFAVRRQRPRPAVEFVLLLSYDHYSFPSGHAARMAALAVITGFFYPPLGGLLATAALTVAAARVMVGIHYVGDVAAGLALGGLVSLAAVVILPVLAYN